MSVEKKKIVCAKEEYNSAQMNTQWRMIVLKNGQIWKMQ
jgi:hypothetical protein